MITLYWFVDDINAHFIIPFVFDHTLVNCELFFWLVNFFAFFNNSVDEIVNLK